MEMKKPHQKIILMLGLGVMLAGCDNPTEPTIKTYKYDVKVCNSVGCDHYDADTVIRIGDTYRLYINGAVSTEIKSQIVVIEKL